jgi:hypothetical protein
VVAVAAQSVFRLEMHQDDVFLFFKKIIFDISTLKRSKNTKKNINFKQKQNSKFFGNAGWTAFPNMQLVSCHCFSFA